MGIDRLLGSGRSSKAITVTVSEASAKATEKIEAAGGSLNMDAEDWDEFEEE
jgi:large subunit ribosomal protein L15